MLQIIFVSSTILQFPSCSTHAVHFGPLTVLEDSLHIQAVSGAGLVVCAALQVIWQLSGPRVIDHSGVGSADCIWEWEQRHPSNIWISGWRGSAFLLLSKLEMQRPKRMIGTYLNCNCIWIVNKYYYGRDQMICFRIFYLFYTQRTIFCPYRIDPKQTTAAKFSQIKERTLIAVQQRLMCTARSCCISDFGSGGSNISIETDGMQAPCVPTRTMGTSAVFL